MNSNKACYIQLMTTGGTYVLELDQEINISLNFSAFDVRDISKKKTSFSKNIPIQNSKNNNIVLGQLWDITTTTRLFDLNKKNRALLFSEGEIVMRGYLRITGVKKTAQSDSQGNQLCYYQSELLDETRGFLDSFADFNLSDLDLSRFNHDLTYANIIASSANTYVQGYTYPQLYKDSATGNQPDPYQIYDYKPAIFLRTYIEQYFGDNGYTWSGTTMRSSQFNSCVVPFNGESASGVNTNFLFRAGFTSPASANTWVNAGTSNAAGAQGGGILIPVQFNNDSTTPNFDTSNSYNTTTNLNVAQYTGAETLHAGWTFELGLNCNQTSYLLGQGFNGNTINSEQASSYLELAVNIYIGGTLSAGTIVNSDLILTASTKYTNWYSMIGFFRAAKIPGVISFPAGTTKIATVNVTGITHNFNQEVLTKLGVWVEAKYIKGLGNNSGWWTGVPGTPLGTIPRLVIRNGYSSQGIGVRNAFYNESTTEYVEGSSLKLNDFIPRSLKMSEVFSSVSQIFNLIMEPDPKNENNIYIDSRDTYYSVSGGSEILDWSDKLCLQDEIEIKFLSEMQNARKLDFTWTEDIEDELLVLYKANNNLTYGELIIDLSNQFLTENREIKPCFAMTPTVNNLFGQPVPFINGQVPKTVVRLLSKSTTNVPINYTFQHFNGTALVTDTVPSYNACTEYSNPITPQWSLNWGTNKDLYYDKLSFLTLNDLYNTYYFNYVNQIATGKVMVAKFNLTPIDISNLRLNSRIYVKQAKCYFIINKIVDYNPVKRTPTRVELIKYDS